MLKLCLHTTPNLFQFMPVYLSEKAGHSIPYHSFPLLVYLCIVSRGRAFPFLMAKTTEIHTEISHQDFASTLHASRAGVLPYLCVITHSELAFRIHIARCVMATASMSVCLLYQWRSLFLKNCRHLQLTGLVDLTVQICHDPLFTLVTCS